MDLELGEVKNVSIIVGVLAALWILYHIEMNQRTIIQESRNARRMEWRREQRDGGDDEDETPSDAHEDFHGEEEGEEGN